MEQARSLAALAFVHGFRNPNEMGLCQIFQDGYELGGYGVLSCSHIMNMDCRFTYEASERRRAPH